MLKIEIKLFKTKQKSMQCQFHLNKIMRKLQRKQIKKRLRTYQTMNKKKF